MIPTPRPLTERPERIGPYRVESALGRGGMGVVWRARHGDSGLAVALKTVTLARESHVVAIRREVRALRRLEHPGIVRIVDDGVHHGRPWYAMDLVEHPTLEALLRGPEADSLAFTLERPAVGPGSAPTGAQHAGEALVELLTVVRHLCGPLGHLHARGLVHRDLKPANIFVLPDRRVVLVDFGLASTFGSQGREALEPGTEIRGTPAYMAPEQFRGDEIDARADLYSLGVILYQAVTGRTPFHGGGAEVARQHQEVAPVPPSQLGAMIDARLEALILRLLAKDRRERLGHADDVDAELAALGVPGPPAEPSRPRGYLYRPALVERDGALAQLADVARRAAVEEAGHLAVIAGESGSGKTYLASAVAAQATSLGLKVVTAACPPPVDEAHPEAAPFVAFRPLLDLAGLHVLTDRTVPEALLVPLRRLAAVDPHLASLPALAALPPPPDLPPDAQATALVDAFVQMTRELTHRLGVMLVIDDLQWADPQSLQVITALVESGTLQSSPLVVLASVRRDEITPAIRALCERPSVLEVRLGPLGRAGVARMAADMLALSEAPAPLVDVLHQHSRGNPYFVAAYLQAAVGEGLLVRRGGTFHATSHDFARLPVPTSLHELLERRLAAVSGAAELLAAAAVLRADFDEWALAAVASMPRAAVDDLVADCVARHVLEADEDGLLRFSHEQLRVTAYARLDHERRRALHGRAGHDLAARGDEGLALVAAEHFRLAGAPRPLFDALRRAGAYAVRTAAFALARDLLREAEALGHSQLQPPAVQADVHRLLGEALLACGEDAAGRAQLGRALALLGEAVPESPGRLVASLGKAVGGQLVRRLAPELWRRRPFVRTPGPDDALRVDALSQLQIAVRADGDAGRILYTTLRSLNLAEDMGVAPVMANGFALAQAIVGAMPWPAAAKAYRRLAHDALAKAHDDPVIHAWVLQMDAVADMGAGRVEASVNAATRGVALAREHRLRQRLQDGSILVAYGSLLLDRVRAAQAAYQALMDDARGVHRRNERWGLSGLCVVAVWSGRLPEAQALRATLDSHAVTEPLDLLVGHAAAALVLAEADELHAALGRLTQGVAQLKTLAPAMLEGAFPATVLADAAWRLAGGARGPLGERTARPCGAPEALDALAALAARLKAMARPLPLLGPEAALVAGFLAVARGKRDAATLLEAARAQAARAGLTLVAQRAAGALARHAAAPLPPDVARTLAERLTPA